MVHVTYVKTSVAWLTLALAHLLPFIAVVIDLSFSSVQFYLRHMVIFFIFGLMYLGYHFIQTFILRGPSKEPIYPSMDWYQKPLMASLLTVSLLIVYVCLCLLMIKVSQIKIRKRFPDGQVLERLSGQNINEEKPQKKRENDDEKGPTSDSQKP